MHFASIEYAILLAATFVLYWGLARLRLLRLTVLLLASYAFYSFWNPYYLGLIIASSAIDFIVGGRLARCEDPRRRKAWLLVSLVANLGLLGVFKYFNFFAASAVQLLGAAGVEVSPIQLDVLLPVGISFYTFQSMSYTIDIYRGELSPVDDALPFFVFVAFFPQLVAGPIVRARQFLPQLAERPSIDVDASGRGFYLIAIGLLKKAVIADLLAVNLVDRVFETPVRYTSVELLAGVYGYAFQIYCDFSAYSDIAIGSALLLGLNLPVNFETPYRAANLRDFWRRWHISLSSWLRDYLYVPLGGSRGASWQTYRNLALTMLLGGLWHGAAWTFVVWGALHGAGLAVTRAWQRSFGSPGAGVQEGTVGAWLIRSLAVLLTFHFVCLAWVFFRAQSFAKAWEMLAGIGALRGGAANVSPLLWALLVAGALTHLLPDRVGASASRLVVWLPAPLQAALLVAAVLAVRYAGTTDVVPFIYFQF